MAKALLSIAEVREEYNVGRDLATHIVKLLPNIRVGHTGRGERLLIRRSDLDRLMARAIEERRTLWEIARNSTPDSLRAWLLEAGERRE